MGSSAQLLNFTITPSSVTLLIKNLLLLLIWDVSYYLFKLSQFYLPQFNPFGYCFHKQSTYIVSQFDKNCILRPFIYYYLEPCSDTD